MEHPFHELANNTRNSSERMLVRAIVIMSVTCFSQMTMEEIYDVLAKAGSFPSFSHGNLEWLKNQLTRMENQMVDVSKGVQRLQTDESEVKQLITDIGTGLQTTVQAISDADTRLQASIDALRNGAGAGDPDAINAVADDLEGLKGSLQTMKDNLASVADAQSKLDQPTGGGTGTLTITPNAVSTLRSNTVQFSASVSGSTFSAQSGSVDSASGLYTPPADTSVTSDTVTATAPDGTTATASVTITDQQ